MFFYVPKKFCVTLKCIALHTILSGHTMLRKDGVEDGVEEDILYSENFALRLGFLTFSPCGGVRSWLQDLNGNMQHHNSIDTEGYCSHKTTRFQSVCLL